MSQYHVLACVTVQKSCEKMILEGAKIAKEMDGEFSVLHVAAKTGAMLGYPIEGDALEYLYKKSSENGASMAVIRSDDVIGSIVSFVKKQDVAIVLIGASRRKGGHDFLNELSGRLPDVIFQTVDSYED